MKKTIISAFILLASSASFAQSDTSKTEQYCQVVATPGLLSNKVTIDIDFGEQKSFGKAKGERLRTYVGKLKKFNTVIGALNFMGKDGWILSMPIRSAMAVSRYIILGLKGYSTDQRFNSHEFMIVCF